MATAAAADPCRSAAPCTPVHKLYQAVLVFMDTSCYPVPPVLIQHASVSHRGCPPLAAPRRVFQTVFVFMNTEVSSFYLDVPKDRLYIRDAQDPSRRACQTVIAELLSGLLAAVAPLVPHMAEDAWLNLPYKPAQASVCQAGWLQPQAQ